MRTMKGVLIAAGIGALMAACATSANATPISAVFNFVPNGTLTADTGNILTATTITSGAPDTVTSIIMNNIGLVGGSPGPGTAITLTSPTPVTLGQTFTKSFSTADGSFSESLTVTSVTKGATSLGIDATGTISCTGCGTLTSSAVFYSAAYTQNSGPGSQINASYNDSTVPPAVPEPLTLSVFGAAREVGDRVGEMMSWVSSMH